jgi:hypothetical protein
MRMRVLFLLLAILSGCNISSAQNSDIPNNSWLLASILRLMNSRDQAIANVKKYEAEIQKCNVTITKSESLLSLARQQANARAEEIAREALAKAQSAKEKNTELRDSAAVDKMRMEGALTRAREDLSAALSHPRKIESIMTDVSGSVSLKKPGGPTLDLRMDQKGFLEKGDEITTSANSHVELQFLDGRGTISLGENSRVKMEEDKAGAQVLSLSQGKADIRVEKLEDFQKEMEERLEAYGQDLETVKDELKQKAMRAFLKSKAFARKLEVETPTCVIADRGTEFVLFVDDRTGTELIVLEGSAEMLSKTGDKTLIIEAGYKCHTTSDGLLSEPEKVDLSKIQRW